MKITHASGEAYDLSPGTQLEIERTNPFFNDYGEQSLPITLPPTDKNRRLSSFPDDISGVSKMSQRADAMVQHGVFSIPARQAILSGNRKTGIETSFYLNVGAFYEKIKETRLSTIFEKKVLTFPSVSAAISFCRSLFVAHDDRFACFPVGIESGSLNSLGPIGADGYPRLYNDVKQTETVDEKIISLDPGYYITPFIRAKYLLKEIFAHFGYTLGESSLFQLTPFKDMVFVNDTIDTIVKGEIRFSQIVPDCNVTTILNVFRYRFCCEFVPDEISKTINIVLFDEVTREPSYINLSGYVVGKYTVNHPASFRQVKLSSEHVSAPDSNESVSKKGKAANNQYDNNFETLTELLKKYPQVDLNKIDGELTRTGFKGADKIVQHLGYITMSYVSDDKLELESKESPDASPIMRYYKGSGGARPTPAGLTIYIGKGRALNSTIVLGKASDTEEGAIEDKASEDELPPILCFVARNVNNLSDFGTIYNYDADGRRLWDYTLSYHGVDGLFERFWRRYDNLLRNSLLEIEVDLMLDDTLKVTLSEYKKIIIDNQELLPNNIKYALGANAPQASVFYTTKLYEPISEAVSESKRLEDCISDYRWIVNFSRSVTGKIAWEHKSEPSVIFFPPPTESEYRAGGRYHEAKYEVTFYTVTPDKPSTRGLSEPEDGILTVWLEPGLK